jgi:uncharacterized protein (DUF433 family)
MTAYWMIAKAQVGSGSLPRAAHAAGAAAQSYWRTAEVFSVCPLWDKLKVDVRMNMEFVERRDGSLYLVRSRVPLARIVYEFHNGETPEAIQSNFPTLSLEQVYGAITFYLGNKQEVEKDMAERRRIEDEFVRTHPNPPRLKQKLLKRREQMLSRRS